MASAAKMPAARTMVCIRITTSTITTVYVHVYEVHLLCSSYFNVGSVGFMNEFDNSKFMRLFIYHA